jgi:hypothetical protein
MKLENVMGGVAPLDELARLCWDSDGFSGDTGTFLLAVPAKLAEEGTGFIRVPAEEGCLVRVRRRRGPRHWRNLRVPAQGR